MLDVDLGFEPGRAASIAVDYDTAGPTRLLRVAKRCRSFRVVARVSAIPGVEAAGISDFLPLGPNRRGERRTRRPRRYSRRGALLGAGVRGFAGIHAGDGDAPARARLHMGRWADEPTSGHDQRFRGAGVLAWGRCGGQVLQASGGDCVVVGVVDDVHADSVEGDPGWQIYYPITQQDPDDTQLVIRTRVPPASMAASVLHALRELNPNQPGRGFWPIAQTVDRAVSPRKFFVLLVGLFAALGLTLASLGIYGVIAYGVTRQTQEIGMDGVGREP